MTDRHPAGARLSAFLDDELSETVAMDLTRHVLACDPCREELESLRAAREALRRLPGLQAPVLTAAVVPPPSWLQRTSRRLRLAAAVATVPALLVAVVYVVGGTVGSDVVPSTELFLVEHVARTAGGVLPSPLGELR